MENRNQFLALVAIAERYGVEPDEAAEIIANAIRGGIEVNEPTIFAHGPRFGPEAYGVMATALGRESIVWTAEELAAQKRVIHGVDDFDKQTINGGEVVE